ncbi:VOC family protein [Thiohalomonas denitrificans]|uniref:VOC family protein n=1 Tax=Thiohalomonas denitrificans TaxID=415747 RepID=UPI001586526B|nr:VOC family protein [Thiohalomonas denitrificans]
MNIDHVALNAVSLEKEVQFFVDFLGLEILQKWESPRQAYVGSKEGPVIGLIENPDYDGSVFTMAHLAFSVPESEFDGWVKKINESDLPVIAGPREQRGGRTILFRTPSKNIVEVCYPEARKTIEQKAY